MSVLSAEKETDQWNDEDMEVMTDFFKKRVT
jgi:hypothetical protein